MQALRLMKHPEDKDGSDSVTKKKGS